MRQRIQISTNFLLYKIVAKGFFLFLENCSGFQSKTYGREVQKIIPASVLRKRATQPSPKVSSFLAKKNTVVFFGTAKKNLQEKPRFPCPCRIFFLHRWSAWKPPKKICLGGLGEIFWGCEKTKKIWGGKIFLGAKCEKTTKEKHTSPKTCAYCPIHLLFVCWRD